ncbi:MAG: flagellar brake protein [Gammaproteobacteria bacterium]|nr:flagellar brake protein [Gammaproteobacteria bacterium]
MASEEITVDIGGSIQLQFVGDDDTRHTARMIGCLVGQSMLVTTPKVNGKVIMVREGLPVVVRMMSGKDIVGFSATVLCTNMKPYPYIHLSYPNDVQAVTVRKALRVNLDQTATVRCCLPNTRELDPDSEPLTVTVRDMSTSGALLVAGKPLVSEGKFVVVKLRMDVAGVAEDLSIMTVVRNVRAQRDENSKKKHYLHGVEFRCSTRRESVMLHAYVYEKIVRGQG